MVSLWNKIKMKHYGYGRCDSASLQDYPHLYTVIFHSSPLLPQMPSFIFALSFFFLSPLFLLLILLLKLLFLSSNQPSYLLISFLLLSSSHLNSPLFFQFFQPVTHPSGDGCGSTLLPYSTKPPLPCSFWCLCSSSSSCTPPVRMMTSYLLGLPSPPSLQRCRLVVCIFTC